MTLIIIPGPICAASLIRRFARPLDSSQHPVRFRVVVSPANQCGTACCLTVDHGVTTNRTLSVSLVIVRRRGDHGAIVGDTTASPLAPVSRSLTLDNISLTERSLGFRAAEANTQ